MGKILKIFFIITLALNCNVSLSASSKHNFDPFYKDFIALHEYHKDHKNLPKDARIEKIIHQFWIGPKLLPDPYKYTTSSCKLDGFEHKMWTNDNYESLLADSPEYRKVFDKIPAYDWAVKKDYLSYLALKKYGGASIDASILCNSNINFLHEHYNHYIIYQYDYLGRDKPHAALAAATIIGMKKNGIIVNDLVGRFANFIDHYSDYNNKYSSDKASFDTSLFHGWMGQIIINEAIHDYCFTKFNGKMCHDTYIIAPDEQYQQYRMGEKFSKAKIKFIDIDSIPTSYVIKSFYTEVTNIYDILGIK